MNQFENLKLILYDYNLQNNPKILPILKQLEQVTKDELNKTNEDPITITVNKLKTLKETFLPTACLPTIQTSVANNLIKIGTMLNNYTRTFNSILDFDSKQYNINLYTNLNEYLRLTQLLLAPISQQLNEFPELNDTINYSKLSGQTPTDDKQRLAFYLFLYYLKLNYLFTNNIYSISLVDTTPTLIENSIITISVQIENYTNLSGSLKCFHFDFSNSKKTINTITEQIKNINEIIFNQLCIINKSIDKILSEE